MTEQTSIRDVQQKLWETEMEILDVIHGICKKNNLRYSLAFGSLLGAIRHGGFIPWDDDIDIMMPREDYEKLISIWCSEAPEGYILQNKDTHSDYSQNFTKIKKDHTTFLESEFGKTANYHKGIFVDIGPCDRVAPGRLGRLYQYVACAVNLLYSRNYSSGSKGIRGFVERTLLKLPEGLKSRIRRRTEKIKRKWNGNKNCPYFATEIISDCKRYFPADLFDEIKEIKFENRNYCIAGKADEFLKIRYGDYMQLPPEEERVWKHRPMIIDFEHNYEELVKEGKV